MIYVDISARSFDATLHSLLALCETRPSSLTRHSADSWARVNAHHGGNLAADSCQCLYYLAKVETSSAAEGSP
jgi:hypothetical protein